MKHLFLFSLGPVQSFIAQARKTHDLYAGSMLLSHLVNKAIDIIDEKHLIFPQRGIAMPNRFLAEVPETEANLQAFGERVENAVRAEWQKIAVAALSGISTKPASFDEQVAGLLEIFWVIEPLEREDRYQETVALLEKNLAAIKNVRPFSQYSWQEGMSGEQGRKCSLDGQRNVAFYRPKNGFDRSETGSPLYSTPGSVCISSQFPEALLQPGEGLSAVSFVKRRYLHSQTNSFKSTAEIALMDALKFLSDPKLTPDGSIWLSEYRSAFPGDGFNSQLYHEEGLSDTFLKNQNIQPGRHIDELRQIRRNLEDLSKAAGYKFQKYYTILTFDGDDMGKWLSGENLKDQSQLRAFQRAFATCLADFAKDVKQRLNNGSGQTVYAGGDDFLGFVNLNHLLCVLKDIRTLFHEKVDVPLQKFKKQDAGKIAFSAGVCVAHYKEPLSLVLQEAKEAQKAAKKLDKKDAFAISVIKGSGENHITALPFGNDAENVERLQTLTDALIQEDFSNNFIKTMRMEFERLPEFKQEQATFEEVFKAELKRLLQRAAANESKRNEAGAITDMLMELFGTRSTENFFQMLHIADFFQREMDKPKAQFVEPAKTF